MSCLRSELYRDTIRRSSNRAFFPRSIDRGSIEAGYFFEFSEYSASFRDLRVAAPLIEGGRVQRGCIDLERVATESVVKSTDRVWADLDWKISGVRV